MLQIRRMRDCDLDQVAAIAASVFSMPWSRQGFAEALPMENACFLVASKDGEVCGYCGAYMAADEGEIINVAVDPGFQRQGIAKLLLAGLRKGFYSDNHEDAYVMNRLQEQD